VLIAKRTWQLSLYDGNVPFKTFEYTAATPVQNSEDALFGRTIGKRAGLVEPVPLLLAGTFGNSVPSMSFDTLLLGSAILPSELYDLERRVAPKLDALLEIHSPL
jgi:hypothetical protein